MEVAQLPVVDFFDPRELQKKSKPKKAKSSHKKRKLITNKLPIGDKIIAQSSSQGEEGEENDNVISDSVQNQDRLIEVKSTDTNKTFADALDALIEKAKTHIKAPIFSSSRQNHSTNFALNNEIETGNQQIESLTNAEKKLLATRGHVKPKTVTDPLEINLRKITTKGAVALFNAIKSHQKLAKDNLNPSYMDKDNFLKLLKSDKIELSASAVDTEMALKKVQLEKKLKSCEQPSWDTLRKRILNRNQLVDWNEEDSLDDDNSLDQD